MALGKASRNNVADGWWPDPIAEGGGKQKEVPGTMEGNQLRIRIVRKKKPIAGKRRLNTLAGWGNQKGSFLPEHTDN